MKTLTTLFPVLYGLGFSHDESLVFLCLVEHGAASVAFTARKTKLSRTTVYKSLEALINKKRIRKTSPKRRTLYEAVDPGTFITELEEMSRQGIQELYQLSAKHKGSLFIPVVSMHEGQAEIHSIYEDIITTLPRGGTYFRYTSRRDEHGVTPLYQVHKNTKEIERLVITSLKKADLKEQDANRFIKTVPKDFAFDDNVTLLIYGQKIAYIDYNSMTGTVIESPQLARFQEKIFKLLWRKL
jgi:predicted transcriptional regulator